MIAGFLLLASYYATVLLCAYTSSMVTLMSKIEIMAEALGMSVIDVIEAVQEAIKTKPRSCHDLAISAVIDMFDWNSEQSNWQWMTATEALNLAGIKEPTRANTTSFGSALNVAKKSKRRRSGGKTLLLIPPVIDSRD